MDKEALLQWYKDNKINDVIEETPFNHFDVSHETEGEQLSKISLNSTSQKLDLQTKIEKTNKIQIKTDIAEFNGKQTITVSQNHTEKKSEFVLQNKTKLETKVETGQKLEIQKEEKVKYIVNNRQDFDFNSIYQNLANKYKNDNMKNITQTTNIDDYIKKARELADNASTVEDLRQTVENFDGYLDIKKLATNTVFGEGDQEANILILGEAPGNNEDLEGRPFCGQSGELLENMFKAIGINREDLYITNTLFWRPPGNRTPTDEEVAICKPFVEKHIALINPKIIIFMGSTALKSLIDTSLTITKARGKIFDYTNQYLNNKILKSTPLFHPSYLLRQSNKKKEAWYDMLFIKKFLEEYRG